jgi:hypothetical protein
MHPILVTGIATLGKELMNRACQSLKGNSPQASFKPKLGEDAALRPQDIGSLKVYKSSLEKQILQHPDLARHTTQSSDPFSVQNNADNTYTLRQGDKSIALQSDKTPLGALLRNYFKTCQHLQEKEALTSKGRTDTTFSFYPA